MQPQTPWTGSRWHRGPRDGAFVLRIPSRIAADLAGLAGTAVACTVLGLAVLHAHQSGSTPGSAPGSAPGLTTGSTAVVELAMSIPVVAALVVLVRIRHSSLYATKDGVWFWSESSPVVLPWGSIEAVDVRRIRRRWRTVRCPVVVTVAGRSFPVTSARSAGGDGAARPGAACERTAGALAEMVRATTGRQVGPTTHEGEPPERVARCEVRTRTLPGGQDDGTGSGDDGTGSGDDGTGSGDDGTGSGDDGTGSGDDGTGVVVATRPVAPPVAWAVALVPAAAGVGVGLLVGTALHGPGHVFVAASSGAAAAVLLWMSGAEAILMTHRWYAVGPDWLAWRYPVAGPWRMLGFDLIARLDLPASPPSPWRRSAATARREGDLAVWVRTTDGRTTVLRLTGTDRSQGADLRADLRARLAEVVTRDLAPVTSDRLRSAIVRQSAVPQGPVYPGDAPPIDSGPTNAEAGSPGTEPPEGSRAGGSSPDVTWPPVLHPDTEGVSASG